MRVVVTRAEPQASQWAVAMRAEGLDALALPLIEVLPPVDRAAVRAVWESMAGYSVAMFVSSTAVRWFSEEKTAAQRTSAGFSAIKTRAWATGPATRQALREAGWAAASIDSPPEAAARFDSEALWDVVGASVAPGDRVLLVRGGDASSAARGRDWFGDRLREAGAHVDTIVAYRRAVPQWDAEQVAQAGALAGAANVWLFASSEAIHNLAALAPSQTWNEARALATHPRIAQAAHEAGFGVVSTCAPVLEDVIASIKSMR